MHMHARSHSDGTGYDHKVPSYYVQSPSSQHVTEVPLSPAQHNHYNNHSRHYSSTSRFSDSQKQYPQAHIGYKSLHQGRDDDDDYEGDTMVGRGRSSNIRMYACLVFAFVSIFTVFCLILWGASKSYAPKISLKGIVFEDFNVQAGIDQSGMPTDMLSLNSTVRIFYRNPATFFPVHVPSSVLQLWYLQILLATGEIKEFSQSRKSQRTILTAVQSHQVPLYGGVPALLTGKLDLKKVVLPMNLTLAMRSKGYVMGKLVKNTFRTDITCSLVLRGDNLGKKINLDRRSCSNFR